MNPRRVVPRSGLPTARSAVRRVAGINRPTRRRKPVRRDVSTSSSAPVGGPYDDPSRDVGEGPDQLTRTQTFVMWVGIFLGIYLASASCNTASVPPPVEHECHICTEFTSGGGN